VDQGTETQDHVNDVSRSGEFLTRADVARFLSVSSRTIARWEHLRQGPPRIKIGNRILYRRESLLDWLKSHEEQPVRALYEH